MTLITEIYQLLFISSIVFMSYVVGNLAIKTYSRFKLKADTRFNISNIEKILFWITSAIFFAYIF